MSQSLFTCVGLNHITSPVEERERLAFTASEVQEVLATLEERFEGAALLSTCNRTELYTMMPAGEGDAMIGVLNDLKRANIDPQHFYVLQHTDAVEHLFRVASGIDSMVLGESQILGQVREAMSAAKTAGTLSGVLARAFHMAISTGKRARTETDIGGHAASVGSAAVALARQSLGDLTGRTVLVISAGSMGKLAAKALAERAGARIFLMNRTEARASQLAEQLGAEAEALGMDRMLEALAEADIVISGTSAEEFILGPREVAPVMERRGGRELLFIDIAVPRDIDPDVRRIDGVHLRDIDDIDAVSSRVWNGRVLELAQVEEIVGEEVARFEEWWESLDVVPVISALRGRAEVIRSNELERTLSRLPELDDESRARIEAMTQAIVKKMLDRPIARLKDGADKARYMKALEDLFDLPPAKTPREP